MHTKPWHVFLVFLAGILAGAIIQRHFGILRHSAELRADQLVQTKSSSCETECARSQVVARIKSEIAAWSTTQYDVEQQKWVAEVPLNDIPTALEIVWIQDRRLYSDLLARWWVIDADAAWNWAEAIQKKTSRDYYSLKVLLAKMAQSDPMGALARAASYQKTDDEFKISEEVGFVLKYKLSKSEKLADDFLALLDSLPRYDIRRPNLFGNVDYEFPPGFDFKHFMDGLERMNGNLPVVMPSGVLRSWAKVDPDAAQAWVLANKPFRHMGSEQWGHVLTIVSEQKGQEEAVRWAAEKYEAADDAGRLRIAEEVVTYGVSDPNMVLEIAKDLRSTTKASTFIRQVMRHEWADLGDQKGMDFKLLRSFATPAERIDVIAEMVTTVSRQEGHLPKDRLECIPERHLQILGVTREQIKQAVIARGGSTVR